MWVLGFSYSFLSSKTFCPLPALIQGSNLVPGLTPGQVLNPLPYKPLSPKSLSALPYRV